ncbi:MAG: cell wall-binding repeat-containing protein [Firmicutes bacterium]|nr:cell wall-binding repeat-containing protein [Bacillota bacterium]
MVMRIPDVTVGVKRIAGDNRYDTAFRIANNLKKELGIKKFDTIVIASGANFPDALSGSSLAEAKTAPILLAAASRLAELEKYVKANLNKGGQIYLLGGTASIPAEIEEAMQAIGATKRLAGKDRYETNLAILNEIDPHNTDFLVTSGEVFPDALSAASVGKPILLTYGKLTDDQKAFLAEHVDPKKKIYIIGGTGSVSEAAEKELGEYGAAIVRVAGNNRYETAKATADRFFPNAQQEVVATGENFPDSLAGGVLAYFKQCPLILTADSPAFRVAHKYAVDHKLKGETILGGSAMVPVTATGFDAKGNFRRGFFRVGEEKYYANSAFEVVADMYFTTDGDTYLASPSGAIVTDTRIDRDGVPYFADKEGVLTKADKIVYMTFDDGPGPYTDELLDIFAKYNAKATFFVCGANGANAWYLDCIGRAFREGHAIGNHTYSHDYGYIYSSEYAFFSDVNRTNEIIKEQTGQTTNLLRFPGGSSNQVSAISMAYLTSRVEEEGYHYFDWNGDSGDAGWTTSSAGVFSNVIASIDGRSEVVVLCHDIHPWTVGAMDDILRWGTNNGYVFLPLNANSPGAHHGTAY